MSIADISHPADLNPKAKFFAEVGDTCINADGAIAICRQIDTPKAKAIYREFRKKHALLRQKPSALSPEKLREEAFFQALASLGFKCNFKRLTGSME